MGNCLGGGGPSKPATEPVKKKSSNSSSKGDDAPIGKKTKKAAPPQNLEIDVQRLSIQEFRNITENFQQKYLIGEGSFGRVYAGQMNARDVAVKKLDASTLPENEFMLALAAMSSLRNRYVTELLAYCSDGNQRVIAYEYATHGSLQDILHGRKVKRATGDDPPPVLTWSQRLKIALGAAQGLEYLHEGTGETVVHKAVKSSNVLVFDDFESKIADFNVANEAPDQASRLQSTRLLGTFGYNAPEYATVGMLTWRSDVYSFGVVLLEILTGRKPLDQSMPRGQQSLVTWASPKLTEEKVKQCVDPKIKAQCPERSAAKFAAVAALCVNYEPDYRPKMSTVVQSLNRLVKEDTERNNK